MDRTPALAILRFVLQPWCILLLISVALGWGTYGYFFGENGDLHRLRLRLYVDGAAPNHRFDAGSNHPGANLSGITLTGAYFPKVRLVKARLADARLSKAIFEGCDLAGANMTSIEARQAKFLMCRLDGADMREADLAGADLSGSSLRLALLAGARLKGANLARTDMTGAVGVPLADLSATSNWHLAVYDEGTARTIAESFQRAGVAVPGFPSWDAWIVEQKKLAITEEHVLEQARP